MWLRRRGQPVDRSDPAPASGSRRGLIGLFVAGVGIMHGRATGQIVGAQERQDANLPGADPKQGWLRASPRAAVRPLADKVSERLSINDFAGADPTGAGDSTLAIRAALDAAAALGLPLHVDGVYRFTQPIRMPPRVLVVGHGVTSAREEKLRARSCLLKDFDGTGWIFEGADCGAERVQFDSIRGRAGDNVVLLGERSFLDWCAVTNAGRDNVRVGSDDAGFNINLWRLTFLITVGAGRHGLHISHRSDANGGFLNGCDARLNGGDGIHVDSCHWSSFLNPVSQLNDGYGFRFTSQARSANVIGGDIEGNKTGQGRIDAGASGLMIDAGLQGVGAWQDDSPVGANRIRTFAPGIRQMTDGEVLAVVNGRPGGIAAVEFFADSGQGNVASIRARQGKGTGGVIDFFTKTDKDEPRRYLTVDERQRASFSAALAFAELEFPASGEGAIDVSRCGKVRVRIRGPVAVFIPLPVNAIAGQAIIIRIENHGQAAARVTWHPAFKLAPWRGPDPGSSIAISFDFDGTHWTEVARSTGVPL